jgi:DNA-binding MarR family transcriptional regulator
MMERNSDISRLLDRMVKKDLVSRSQCPNDKRATDIRITKAGLDILKKIDVHIDEAEKRNIRLTSAEAQQLSDLLDKARG